MHIYPWVRLEETKIFLKNTYFQNHLGYCSHCSSSAQTVFWQNGNQRRLWTSVFVSSSPFILVRGCNQGLLPDTSHCHRILSMVQCNTTASHGKKLRVDAECVFREDHTFSASFPPSLSWPHFADQSRDVARTWWFQNRLFSGRNKELIIPWTYPFLTGK